MPVARHWDDWCAISHCQTNWWAFLYYWHFCVSVIVFDLPPNLSLIWYSTDSAGKRRQGEIRFCSEFHIGNQTVGRFRPSSLLRRRWISPLHQFSHNRSPKTGSRSSIKAKSREISREQQDARRGRVQRSDDWRRLNVKTELNQTTQIIEAIHVRQAKGIVRTFRLTKLIHNWSIQIAQSVCLSVCLT